jgi:ubiquinone/menaquinone biosynthesis C-methylase UbiE
LIEEGIFIRLVEPKKGERILDVGCGTGRIIGQLLKRTKHVEGTDVSEEMLDVAKKRFPNVSFFRSDIEKRIPRKGNTYDKITCSLVLQFISNLERTLSEFHRVLKPRGKVFITDFVDGTMSYNDVTYRLERRRDEARDVSREMIRAASRFKTLRNYIDVADKVGFKVSGIVPLRVQENCKRYLTADSYRKTKGKWGSVLLVLEKH